MGWDVSVIDSYADMTGKKVKEVLDEIMLLTGSIYYINYNQEFIIEPVIPASPTSICTIRGDDIFKINSEKYDWKGHYTGIKWEDSENPMQRVEMSFADRELYQYDYSELLLKQKYITDQAKRFAIMDNLLDIYKFIKRQVVLECKWNPQVIVNKYIALDVPQEAITGDKYLVWNKNKWNAGKYWGIESPGINFLSAELWRVLDIKRDSQGRKMQLTLVQLYSDDEV